MSDQPAQADDRTELTYTRVFDAPRELVFRCMVEPEHLTHFWGPVGTSAPLDGITVDARPGGVFEVVMVNDADGSTHRSRGVYVAVDEPERLVWNEPDLGMTTSTTFVALDDGRTEVTVHQTNVPAMVSGEEAQRGFRSAFDRFDAYLATL